MLRFHFHALRALCLVVVLAAPSTAANLLVNGGFEEPAIDSGFAQLDNPSLPGWFIAGIGGVDVVKNDFWAAFEGTQSLDLDGNGPGRILQSFVTDPGAWYTFSFAYANNPQGTVPASANVVIGYVGGLLVFDVITHDSSTFDDMDYTIYSTNFQAVDASTYVDFASLSDIGSVGGIVLDAVSVTSVGSVVPEPSSLALSLLAGITALRIRRRGRAA